ncbi:M23 family metallopeptidase [Oceanibacterium hippocampi]|uniref:Murein DD-endopeptidase MepM n=1 Tax=Oceanibacterium hippocampi TaxID=745714 RepID=A0A1Y5R5V0_9PROT|nr:peptidoglycan DD-metalloendopeptidase family protein [Oceanibacterium hippocampi]SLN09899.1 Murein DD-endopeptidase MepM [Oceanibacterium hippocampi]
MTKKRTSRFKGAERRGIISPATVALSGVICGAVLALAGLALTDGGTFDMPRASGYDERLEPTPPVLESRANRFLTAEAAPLESPIEVALAPTGKAGNDDDILGPVLPGDGPAQDPEEVEADPDSALVKAVAVAKGDTLAKLLARAGTDSRDAHQAITALSEVFDPRRLRIGQEIRLEFSPLGEGAEGELRLSRVSLMDSVEHEVSATRRDDAFTPEENHLELERSLVRSDGVINSSLFLAARDAGLPPEIVIEMIRIFSFDVDFQREVQPGDRFSVYYESFRNDAGETVKYGNILLAGMTLSGEQLTFYRFTPDDDGVTDYFTATGQSVKKTLMRTPIDGARLSSGFGKRRHPILGYTKMHRGVDFAAPSGTPIMAAGDGVVEFAGRHGGYGNYVRIRHNGTYKTAYAHMRRFGKGVRAGTRVRQGQIIGYVGTTGRSTGPHLHYEVLKGDHQVNPLAIKLPTGRKLSGSMLARFAKERDSLETRFAAAPVVNRQASAD